MSRAALLATLSVILLAGCNGPKGSPDGTVKAFYSAIESRDWMDLGEMVDPDSLKKSGGPEQVASFYYSMYEDVQNVDLTIEEALITRPDQEAAVRFKCTATFRAMGQLAYDRDCSDTLALRWHGGKWFIVVPGSMGLAPRL